MSDVDAIQVIGMVGSSRKRTLMLWQAVELSRVMERPNMATLQIARKALEPPDDPLEQVYWLQAAVILSTGCWPPIQVAASASAGTEASSTAFNTVTTSGRDRQRCCSGLWFVDCFEVTEDKRTVFCVCSQKTKPTVWQHLDCLTPLQDPPGPREPGEFDQPGYNQIHTMLRGKQRAELCCAVPCCS